MDEGLTLNLYDTTTSQQGAKGQGRLDGPEDLGWTLTLSSRSDAAGREPLNTGALHQPTQKDELMQSPGVSTGDASATCAASWARSRARSGASDLRKVRTHQRIRDKDQIYERSVTM